MMRQRFAKILPILSSLVGSTISTSTKDHLASKNYGAFECLPDCIIINILRRLPIDCILKCQRVCRLWKALISSRYFATLLHDTERLFIQYDELDFFVLEENDNKEEMFKKVSLKPELTMMKHHPHLLHSCQGLLLFGDHVYPSTYFVFNPITQEEVTIKHTLGAGSICGFYLCPLTKELKILYAKVRGSSCQYLIYTIRSQTWRRIRSPSLNAIPTYLSPAIVDGAMHWIMDREFGEDDIPPCSIAILMFKLDTEELSLMSHPGTQCSSRLSRQCRTHETMSLLVKEEHLSFCQLRIHENAMDIWILEDYEMRTWIRSYRVNLNLSLNVFPYHSPSDYCKPELMNRGMAQFVKPLRIHDGELLICWSLRGLFLYNLDRNTVRRIEGPQGKRSTLTPFTCMPYTRSLRHIV